MTPLYEILLRQISRFGPLSVAEYMSLCLYHPKYGYYTQAQPLGRAGDFITAPEISQMFGEMLGLCLAQNWLDQGAPNPFCLAELGPGSGQLMSDALRATKAIPGFHQAAQLHLCELNSHLKEQQSGKLGAFSPTWIDSTSDLPDLPLYLIANEFLDCLPISQFVATQTGWSEQVIACQDNQLGFARQNAGPMTAKLPTRQPKGTIIELCPAANAIVQDLARIIAGNGGCVLILDYGGTGDGDTLQAVQNHQRVDPLSAPGQADLTAHVNFQALKDALSGATVTGPISQGPFLEGLGITTRAKSLANALCGDALENHIAAHRRLTHPDEMGHLFKVMTITPPDAPLPAGFGP